MFSCLYAAIFSSKTTPYSFIPIFIIPSAVLFLSSTYLHVALQLQQMKTVPGDKPRSFMGEVYTTKACLACSQEGFTDRIIVAPNKVIVYGDVLKLWSDAIWPKHLLVPAK